MPPKAKIQAAIDRPLSRAYLREFTGWSTAFPPGLSDPTSLRVMENIVINRDGAAQIRPGLRYLISDADDTPLPDEVVGTHEAFYMNDGTKAYLFAVRGASAVEFRVYNGGDVKTLTEAGFIQEGDVTFSSATTYVKYLQIDNKIIALNDAGEAMVEFFVGDTKKAKRLRSINRPDWTVSDKLTVVHPAQAWINTPATVRRNQDPRAGVETWSTDSFGGFVAGANTEIKQASSPVRSGSYCMEIASKPERTNYMPYPLGDGVTTEGWTPGTHCGPLTMQGGYLTGVIASSSPNTGFINGPEFFPPANTVLKFTADIISNATFPYESTGFVFRFINSSGGFIGADTYKWIDNEPLNGRFTTTVSVPAGTVKARAYIAVRNTAQPLSVTVGVRNVTVQVNDSFAIFPYFDGDGIDCHWLGTPQKSVSVYHPAKSVSVTFPGASVTAGADYWNAIYVRAGSVVRTVTMDTLAGSPDVPAGVFDSGGVADVVGSWTRLSRKVVPPAGSTFMFRQLTIPSVGFGEKHYVDDMMIERDSGVSAPAWFDGYTPDSDTVQHGWEGPIGNSVSRLTTFAGGATQPTPATPTANTLISSTASLNTYNFGFFYAFFNELGESAMSQVKVLRAQRAWPMWRWETANAAAEPSGTPTSYPNLCADQLVASMPEEVFNDALASGAIGWNLYMFSWSDQSPVPTTAVKVATVDLSPTSTYDAAGWAQVTPPQAQQAEIFVPLPTKQTLYNFSAPSRAGQGIVAADRLVLVKDPSEPAVVRWSSNLQGRYTDFSANAGGGYKTLTYGNLYIPACVKLWQNPQSTDTLTILCLGTDGHSTSYYMAPAEVSAQSETTQIMGFEETTATPGTTSPYGVEVFNNALYHPLDDQLMKSTANNYNISHKSQTENIRNVWSTLQNKEMIVSSQHDGRLYFLVNNPDGADLEPGCRGNEVWVFDAQSEKGNWSRWLTQGHSLRKVQQGASTYMSLARPDGFYTYDWAYPYDDVVVGGAIEQRAIPWQLETNTQGANRAHDAWCHLSQANLTVGNFTGTMRYGIRGKDRHGKLVTREKVLRSPNPETADPAGALLTFDQEDFLRVGRDLKEWFFFASSVEDEGVTLVSGGQLSLVQYRYAPISVNVGYEYGSVETFEYGAAGLPADSRSGENGVPWPDADTLRP